MATRVGLTSHAPPFSVFLFIAMMVTLAATSAPGIHAETIDFEDALSEPTLRTQ